MAISRLIKSLTVIAFAGCFLAGKAGGQQPGEKNYSIEQTSLTLKVQRNEVPVRVVVRDRQRQPVRKLTREDFRVLDDRKPQVITHFSSKEAAPGSVSTDATMKESLEASPPPPSNLASRFVALFFDDLVMDFEGVARTRIAAPKYFQTYLSPNGRVAIATSSGRHQLEFPSDRDKLQQALLRLQPNGFFNKVGRECPDLSDYEAYLIS